jgi:hypothetical protein
LNGRITLQDFADNDNDEDSNASDEDFKIDEDYKDEVTDAIALEIEDGSVGNDDPDLQEDYFQIPIQQHENSVRDNNEATSTIIPRNKRGSDPVVTLSNSTVPTKESNKQKKKITINDDMSIEDILDDCDVSHSNVSKVGVSDELDIDDDIDGPGNNDAIPKELDSDLGPYWALAQSTQAYVLNTIASYSNTEASKSTPQYGFNRGLKEFGTLGYEATVKELDDNLPGMGAVKMDLQVAVAYLCTRVKCLNQSDYRKLTRVIKYLQLTIFIPLVLGWDGMGHLTWSVDASFAVHKDMYEEPV